MNADQFRVKMQNKMIFCNASFWSSSLHSFHAQHEIPLREISAQQHKLPRYAGAQLRMQFTNTNSNGITYLRVLSELGMPRVFNRVKFRIFPCIRGELDLSDNN